MNVIRIDLHHRITRLCAAAFAVLPALDAARGEPILRSPFDPRGEMHIPIGVADTLDTLKTYVEPQSCFSPGAGSYGVYFWVYENGTGKLTSPTFDAVAVDYGLTEEGYLIPWSSWSAGDIAVRTEVCHVQRDSPKGNVFVAAARVRLRNTDTAHREVSLFAAIRPLGPAGFAIREITVTPEGDGLLVEGHPAIVAISNPAAAGVSATDTLGELLSQGRFPSERTAASEAGTCSGVLRHDLALGPNQEQTLEFICPVLPGRRAARHQWDDNPWFKLDQAQFNPLQGGVMQPDPGPDWYRRLSPDELFDRARDYCSNLVGPPRIKVPDPRWEQCRAAIVGHLSLCLNEGQPDLVAINLSPFVRDGVYMANTLQKAGQFDIASIYIDYFLGHPFMGRVAPEADNPGQILWSLGETWKLRRDQQWLARVYPAVVRFADLIRYYRTTPGPHWVWDDTLNFGDALPGDKRKELKPGACDGTHPEYTEAFDIAGLRAAALLAGAAGQPDRALEWRKLADELFARYDSRFGNGLGREYGSYAVLWPCRLYPLGEGKARQRFSANGATKTGEWRYFPLATAHQGLLAGNRSAGYGTLNLHLAEKQMKGWYSFDEGGPSGVGGWPKLLTTWSWNYPRPDWAKVSACAMPNGWVLAELWLLMRDSLLFEDGDRLVLLGGVSPDWFGREMAVIELPTWFGPCSFRYVPKDNGATLTLDGATPPGGFVLRLPRELPATVEADGRRLERTAAGDIAVPVGKTRVELAFD